MGPSCSSTAPTCEYVTGHDRNTEAGVTVPSNGPLTAMNISAARIPSVSIHPAWACRRPRSGVSDVSVTERIVRLRWVSRWPLFMASCPKGCIAPDRDAIVRAPRPTGLSLIRPLGWRRPPGQSVLLRSCHDETRCAGFVGGRIAEFACFGRHPWSTVRPDGVYLPAVGVIETGGRWRRRRFGSGEAPA